MSILHLLHLNPLSQKYKALEAENEHLRSVQECHGIDLRERDNAIKSYVAERDELKRQLAEYKADAEKNAARLAFVTETTWRVVWRHNHGEPKKYRMIDDGDAWGKWYKTAKEAIDAAMKGDKE